MALNWDSGVFSEIKNIIELPRCDYVTTVMCTSVYISISF